MQEHISVSKHCIYNIYNHITDLTIKYSEIADKIQPETDKPVADHEHGEPEADKPEDDLTLYLKQQNSSLASKVEELHEQLIEANCHARHMSQMQPKYDQLEKKHIEILEEYRHLQGYLQALSAAILHPGQLLTIFMLLLVAAVHALKQV